MAHDTNAHCLCVAEHRPPVLEYERHHIWPLYLGGSNLPGNLVWICPSTHANIHEIVRLMAKAGRVLSYHEVDVRQDRPVSRYAHRLAAEGFAAHIANMEEMKDDAA